MLQALVDLFDVVPGLCVLVIYVYIHIYIYIWIYITKKMSVFWSVCEVSLDGKRSSKQLYINDFICARTHARTHSLTYARSWTHMHAQLKQMIANFKVQDTFLQPGSLVKNELKTLCEILLSIQKGCSLWCMMEGKEFRVKALVDVFVCMHELLWMLSCSRAHALALGCEHEKYDKKHNQSIDG